MTEQEKEKVLHGLNSCGFCDGVPNICEVTECPYRGNKGWCVHELAHDAGMLIGELMRESEAVEPEPKDVIYDDVHRSVYCPSCDNRLAGLTNNGAVALETEETPNYCWMCGQAVKW